MIPRIRFALLAAVAIGAGGCGKRAGYSGRVEAIEGSSKAVISLARVDSRTAASEKSAVAERLPRGTEVQLLAAQGDFWRVSLPKGGEVWVPAGSFERLSDREARERRAKAVASFPVQPGRAMEPCPILLAPAYGASRWGDLEDGDDVSVLMPDHDFYGIRLPDAGLAFVPARSIRLLPSPSSELPNPEPPRKRDAIVPAITPLATPVATVPTPGPGVVPGAAPTPFAALPAGSEPPVLVTRVDPAYPEPARRARLSGEVTLAVVVEANGTVGKIDVVNGGPLGMTEAAIEAVRRWTFRPARVDGKPVPVVKRVHVRFSLEGRPPAEPAE